MTRSAWLGLGSLLITATIALGQSTNSRVELDRATFAQDVAKSEDFSYLSDLREDLSRQVADAEQTRDQMTKDLNKLGNLPTLQRFVQEKEAQLKAAEKANNLALAEELRNGIGRVKDDIADFHQLSKALADEKQRLTVLLRNRSMVEQRIISLLREAKDTGTFRWVTSVSFCVLVLFVIAGFYIIAWYKDKIAYTIFAGEKGMQFITLFLIVIAIILFGIMGTLEGKELAALLGGLSGYILGRTSSTVSPAEEKV